MEATNSPGSEKGYEYLKVNCLCNIQCVDESGLQVIISAYCYSWLNLITHNLLSDCLLLDGVAQPCLMILTIHSCVDDVTALKYRLYNGENLKHPISDLYDTLQFVCRI